MEVSKSKNPKFWHETNCVVCNKPFWSLIKRNQTSCSGKCSGIYVAQNPNRISKIKATKLAKYGSETYVNPDKAKLTCFEKYGVDNASKSDAVIEKIKTTTQERYGVDSIFKTDDFKKKTKEYNLKNFGAEKVSQRENIKQKKMETADVNYDVDNPLQSDEVKEKIPLQLVGTSQSAQEIAAYVKTLTTDLVVENSRDTLPSGLELDIYIPSKKLAIEFDGLYFHSELAGKSKDYHLKKTEECEELGIHLIHIFEDEWKNKQELIKNKLKSKFSTGKRVGARKLAIEKISGKVKNEFLIKNHIQGKDMSSICYGAFYNKVLVAVATFSKPRLALGQKNKSWDHEYELGRYATSIPIVGALPKIMAQFIEEYGCKKIYSFADRRFTSSKNNIYQSVGFKLIGKTNPNYWYFQDGYYKRSHRFGYRKSELSKRLADFDPLQTEWENMVANGWNRIYDCGSLKYEYIVP